MVKSAYISGYHDMLLVPHALQYMHAASETENYICNQLDSVQWSFYFKTTHGTKEMWSNIAGGLKIKVI